MANNNIVIRGAKEHNLKNIDVTIPRDKLVVLTGLSDREGIWKAFPPTQECFSVRWKSLM